MAVAGSDLIGMGAVVAALDVGGVGAGRCLWDVSWWEVAVEPVGEA